jgi:hypothetical protein
MSTKSAIEIEELLKKKDAGTITRTEKTRLQRLMNLSKGRLNRQKKALENEEKVKRLYEVQNEDPESEYEEDEEDEEEYVPVPPPSRVRNFKPLEKRLQVRQPRYEIADTPFELRNEIAEMKKLLKNMNKKGKQPFDAKVNKVPEPVPVVAAAPAPVPAPAPVEEKKTPDPLKEHCKNMIKKSIIW